MIILYFYRGAARAHGGGGRPDGGVEGHGEQHLRIQAGKRRLASRKLVIANHHLVSCDMRTVYPYNHDEIQYPQ